MEKLSKERMILPGLVLGFLCGFAGYTAGSFLGSDDEPGRRYGPAAAHAGEMRHMVHRTGHGTGMAAVEIPGFEIPEIRIPAIEIPGFRIDAIHIPGFTVPGGEVAPVHVPAVDVPGVVVPEVVVPAVRVPGMRVAEVPDRRDPTLEHTRSHGHGWGMPGDHEFKGADGADKPAAKDPATAAPEQQSPDRQATEKPRKRERSIYGVKLISL